MSIIILLCVCILHAYAYITLCRFRSAHDIFIIPNSSVSPSDRRFINPIHGYTAPPSSVYGFFVSLFFFCTCMRNSTKTFPKSDKDELLVYVKHKNLTLLAHPSNDENCRGSTRRKTDAVSVKYRSIRL